MKRFHFFRLIKDSLVYVGTREIPDEVHKDPYEFEKWCFKNLRFEMNDLCIFNDDTTLMEITARIDNMYPWKGGLTFSEFDFSRVA